MPKRTASPPADETKSAVAADATREELCLLVSTASGVRVERLARARTHVLGRGEESTILVEDPSVSRQHAKIVVGEHLALVNLGSRNGSKVDGVPAPPDEPVPLRVGSTIELGSATLILQRAAGFVDTPSPAPSPTLSATQPPPTHVRQTGGPIVRDPAMARIYGLLDVVAPSPLSVLILGETGVGKEVFAEELHRRSLRRDSPFLKLNCAAIPESLLEGELFGYEKGAFTGANQSKAGLFELADHGTVLLDEIGEVPPTIQAKLLRVLESGEFLRLGAVKSTRVDVRFLSATNRDLRALIAQGQFRSDLYFRLNGVSLTLPSLRKRVLDIAPLAELFKDGVSARLKRPPPRLSDAARSALEAYAWPGNVRELRNVVERAVVMGNHGEILPEHLMLAEDAEKPSSRRLPPVAGAPSTRTSAPPAASKIHPDDTADTSREALQAKLEEMDKKAIVDALEKSAGNQSQAAKLLGLTRKALIYRIETYGIARPRKRD